MPTNSEKNTNKNNYAGQNTVKISRSFSHSDKEKTLKEHNGAKKKNDLSISLHTR